MKKTLLLYILLIASIPVLLAQPGAFDFTPNNTSGGAIATVTVNGEVASSSDWIAAFDEDGNCAGAVQLLDYYGEAFCNLQVYGNDVTTPDLDEGVDAGETFTFKLWVAASDDVLDHPDDLEPVATWDAGLNGSPCPGYGFSDDVELRFMGESPPDVMGCTDMAACNYNVDATVDDGSCVTVGATCDDGDAATINDVYQADCTCAGETEMMVVEDSDECVTAVNISAAFSEECEMIGPYEQGDATVGTSEPPLPSCFNDGYDGTTWYAFVVPDDIAGGSPTDYIVSTGAFADCTANPLANNADTQIAIFDGESGCPSGSASAIACNDDYSNTPPYVSSVQVTLTPGNQYYIMVETFGGNLAGEFCFYIQPLADFLGGGTKDCTNCNDGVCNGVVGEMFSNCPTDCPCDAGIASNSIDENGVPGLSLNYEAYCPETVGGTGGGLFVPFTITSSNVPMGPDNVTFLNSTLTTTVGSIYTYNFGGSPSPQTGNATQNVTLIYLTPDDVTAVNGGAQIVLSFVDESGGCAIVEPVDVDLTTTDCGTSPVEGCTEMDACNYDATATVDDGSCTTNDCAGVCGGTATSGSPCTDANGNTSAYADDCSCPPAEVEGCTDMDACNFDAAATIDDGSCTTNDCAGECGGSATEDCAGVCGGSTTAGSDCMDADGNDGTYNGSCDCVAEPIPGCTNADACNFNSSATTDDGSCVIVAAGAITFADGSAETSICVNDGVDEPIDVTVTDAGQGPNGAWVITDSDANILALPDGPPFILDGAGIGTCLIWWLNFDDLGGADVGANAGDLTGCFALSNSIAVVREECVTAELGCTDMDACNYDAAATEDDGSCTVDDCAGTCGGTATPGTACTDADGNASTYDADCTCPTIFIPVPGCTDATACNYDADANMDNDTCEYNDCEGVCGGTAIVGATCVDSMGNSGTIESDCSCLVPTTGPTTSGCTDASACNYDADATEDDGTCQYNDCAGVCGGAAVVGAACDDGDANTNNDAYNADCECAGLPIDPGCLSQAGILTLVEGGAYGGMNYICAGSCATVSASDFLLDAGQGVKIVWHTDGEIGADNFPPANILGSGSFYCNEAGIKQTVYATAFGATKDADDEIDYSDYCLTFSNTLAITLLPTIDISVVTQCDDSNGNFTYTFNVDGGLPECAPGQSYTVTGDYFSGEIAPGETQSVGPIADGANFSITVTDPNGCTTTYTDVVTCGKLPITLELFTGDAISQGNLLKWVTATEINNDYFSLQASTNGVNFSTIATIKGQGNSNTPIAYDHIDRAAAKGTTYYRLVQTDYDGTQSKSDVIEVTRGESAFNITDLYPIPTTDVITLQYVAPEQSNIDIEVFDLIGQTLIQYQRISDGGVAQLDISVEDLPAGIYFVSIISYNDKVTQKFVIE